MTTECKEGLVPDKGDVSWPYLVIQVSIYNKQFAELIHQHADKMLGTFITHESLSNAIRKYSAVWALRGGGGVTMMSSDALRGISGP